VKVREVGRTVEIVARIAATTIVDWWWSVGGEVE
jgi:hypothetical protein